MKDNKLSEEAIFDKLRKDLYNQPVQFYKEQNELTRLKERWVSLIRMHAKQLVDYAHDNSKNICSPDLFDIANEIDAFFTGLNSK